MPMRMPKSALVKRKDAQVKFAVDVSWMDVSTLQCAEWNFKSAGDDDDQQRFEQSLKRSVVTPLHVATCAEDKKVTEIIDGAHRFKHLVQLGAKKLPVIHHGVLTIAERKEAALRYNGAWFSIETLPLAECLSDVRTGIPDAEFSLPYSTAEFDQAVAAMHMDAEADLVFEDDDDEEELAPPKKKKKASVQTLECPHCHKKFNLSR